MKISAVPENWLERLAVWLKIAPTPICDTHMTFMMARTIMVGVKVGIFEALADSPKTADQVAARCATHAKATRTLLNTLVHLEYVTLKDNRYQLSSLARRWMLKDSPRSLHDKMLLQFLEWKFVEHYEDYLYSGAPLDYHNNMDGKQWQAYQRGMRSVAGISVEEVAQRTPMPPGATQMLDIGGAHGSYSVALCRKYPQLAATILDLPAAVEYARPILAEEKMGNQVVHQAGNALTDDLGEATWDIVFISSLVHHFDDDANAALAKRIARALKPGGYFIVQDFIRIDTPAAGDHLGGLFDLFFAATSEAGTYSEFEVRRWQQQAGLQPKRSVWLRSIPRHAQIVAEKL
ncbi:class I SAM-dependent methyltransferase [Tunicatimonas pelagia]|uniref:class I SAM-dependent methyltransferase n=1 Tax=Tunicatimonas pelagia TaxID=931531 RepID=UPI002666A066|nr:class I SAM-dependent methyltransferase [Tunicatimonas pelagia]WKN46061.1 class I SAM-dependent methyltransferase [Tunicatimonas pelagia]